MKAQRDLIVSIPEIVAAVAATILAELLDLSAFESADQHFPVDCQDSIYPKFKRLLVS